MKKYTVSTFLIGFLFGLIFSLIWCSDVINNIIM